MCRYYYDEQTSQCLTFTYTGCGGGKNQFDRSRDCELYCSGKLYSAQGKKEKKEGKYLFTFTIDTHKTENCKKILSKLVCTLYFGGSETLS